jgi:hypothetical protein
MPKTIAITPSWYWPAGVPRVIGVPRLGLHELAVERRARRDPDALALVDDGTRVTNAELAALVREKAATPACPRELLAGPPTVTAVVGLLGALAAGAPLRAGMSAVETSDPPEAPRPGALDAPAVGLDVDGAVAWHSHRSLLAGAVAFGAFCEIDAATPWCSTFPLASWEGLYGVLTPLLAGAPVVLSEPGPPALGAIAREGVGVVLTDLESAFATTRDAKRDVKSVRGVLHAILCSVPGPFDADERRRVGRLFECAALTLFGRAETGPIFAAHRSWYLDEAVGIPVTNAHVVPVDPRSGVPLATLWELVESAMVTVWTPALMVGYEGGAHPDRFRDGRFVTGTIASSDGNGMIYVLPD